MIYRLIAVVILLAGLAACSGNTEPAASNVDATPAYVSELRGAVVDPPRELADFTLASTQGDTFTLSEHRGQVILLYFGYRSCPDFCPTTFAMLQRAYKALDEPQEKVKVVFVTIDPERDTLDYLKMYAEAFHPDFLALRGEGQTLQDLEAQFGVVAERREVGESALSYLYDHTATLFLIDPNGKLQAQYLYGTGYGDIVHDVGLIIESI